MASMKCLPVDLDGDGEQIHGEAAALDVLLLKK